VGGIFTEFDVVNENNRIYSSNEFIPHLKAMNEKKEKLGVLYGEFDHPADFETSLKTASHVIEKAEFNKTGNNVLGEIRLLSTFWGKEAQAIVNDELPLFVSSRAAGTTDAGGKVSMKKLFTYDLVADPGFSSAKMSLNESCGLSATSNIQIYDLTNEEKTNNLFDMNKNDIVTKTQLSEYSVYLKEQLEEIQNQINNAVVRTDNVAFEELLAKYENLQENQAKMIEYLDYMAENVQVLKAENLTLKQTQSELITHSDHIAENVNRVIEYSNYVGEKLDQSINYTNHLSENINKSIRYAEYLAETVNSNIEYTNYLAENIDRSIEFSNYLSENLDRTIEYTNYISENVDRNIQFSNYLSEKVDETIQYSEYLAENLDNNVKYSEYIAENLDSNIKYAEYLAENLDSNIKYSEYLAENLESGIQYSEYLAENISHNIKYTEYLAEHVDSGIQYSEYLAENLHSSINYSNYLAESVETSVAYTESIAQAINESLNVNIHVNKDKIFENVLYKESLALLEDNTDGALGGETNANDDMLTHGDFNPDVTYSAGGTFNPSNPMMKFNPGQEIEAETKAFKVDDIVSINGTNKVGTILELDGIVAKVQIAESDEVVTISADQLTRIVDMEDETPDYKDIDYKDLKESYNKLINKSNKLNEVSNTFDNQEFLELLNNDQKLEWMCLSNEQKAQVVTEINESDYFSANTIVKAIRESNAGIKRTNETKAILKNHALKGLY
jgi:hypothetical protein